MVSTRSYFRRLAEGFEDGPATKIWKPLLGIASGVYSAVSGTTRALYEGKILKSEKLPFPVISVGNLTWGGTGKTPFVEYLARRISDRQRTPLVLTRGYNHDEVEQFKHHLPRAIIGVGKNRAGVAREIASKQKVDAAILDDGFQHWPVQRDFEIVMVNALNPFGNGNIIPRGILRESPAALKRAHAVVITHANLVSPKELNDLKTKIRQFSPDVLLLDSYLEPLFFYRAKKRARVPIERLQRQKVTTFSAVGAPRSFQLLLTRLQIRPIRNFEFTDHHVFSGKELEEIKNVSHSASADEIITTEKDYYRAPDAIANSVNPLVLATRLRISSGEEFLLEKLHHLLGVAGS